MGKKFLIYLKGDVEDEFEVEENKSQLVSRLLKEHYAEGEEALEAKRLGLSDELDKVTKKLKNKRQEASKRAREAKGAEAREKSARAAASKKERDRLTKQAAERRENDNRIRLQGRHVG